MAAGAVKSYSLPAVTASNGDSYTKSVNLGSASSFTKYSSGSFVISPSSTAASSTTAITVTLTDTKASPTSNSYTFNIIVQGAA